MLRSMVSSHNFSISSQLFLTSFTESYLRARPETAVYKRDDFDSLSNKFLSKLVIRAGAA